MVKYVVCFLFVLLSVNLYGNETETSSTWKKAIEQTDFLWDKTKQITLNTIDGAKNIASNGVHKTSNILSEGKQIILKRVLLTSLNAGLDYNDTIKVNDLRLNSENGSFWLLVKLDGEDRELSVDVKHFDWDIIENKQFIILENIDVSLDIAWLDYILQEYLKTHNGYIKVKYSLAKETFLRSLKENRKTTYVANITSNEQKIALQNQKIEEIKEIINKDDENFLENIIKELFDEAYVSPIFIKKNGNSLECNFSLAESEKDFFITFEDFEWATANEKKLIVIEKIKLKDCSKPWIESILKKYHEQIIFKYNPLFEEILTKIKPKKSTEK
jgi:hypothetical protein